MRSIFSSDKSLTFLPVIRCQLNCHPFRYKNTPLSYSKNMRSTFSNDKSLTFLPVIRWMFTAELPSLLAWTFELKQNEVKHLPVINP